MGTTTANQGFRIPTEDDVPDVPVHITNLANDVERRVISVCASIADRDSRIAAPDDGQFAYVKDVNLLYIYQDGSWVTFPPTQPLVTSGSTVPDNTSGNNGDIFFKV